MSVMAYAPYGAGGMIVRVEADIRRGIPGIDITGLAEGAVREARERVRAAFRNSGLQFPADRVLINLAPAGLRKDGAALDLPIAFAVMAAAGIAPVPQSLLVMGELELSGRIRPVRGVLAAIAAGLEEGIREFIIPAENRGEARVFKEQIHYSAPYTLSEAVNALYTRETDGVLPAGLDDSGAHAGCGGEKSDGSGVICGDFADARGQSVYKRVLEIAAAGGHNALVFGPPGVGKTMLSRLLPAIMAPLSQAEAIEVTRLHSLAGPRNAAGSGYIDRLITSAPFRAPHHSASAEGILGGGRPPKPGEISLAHYGVLFLDEAPEFKKNVLQALREPLEDRVISISRAEGQLRLPAEFQLLLAANACPCGKLGAKAHTCLCSPEEITRYWKRFGGALLDRIELRAPVLPPQTSEIGSMLTECGGETSAQIALRVEKAVEMQTRRYKGAYIRRNALIPSGKIAEFCAMSLQAQDAFHHALAKTGLSGRACHGILRVARSIADLDGKDIISQNHVLEAVQHRRYGDDPYEIITFEAGG